jgi:hypothetical protein
MTDTATTNEDSGKHLPYYHVLDGLRRANQCPPVCAGIERVAALNGRLPLGSRE